MWGQKDYQLWNYHTISMWIYAHLIATTRNKFPYAHIFCFGITSTYRYWYQYIQHSPIQILSHLLQCFICLGFCFEKSCTGEYCVYLRRCGYDTFARDLPLTLSGYICRPMPAVYPQCMVPPIHNKMKVKKKRKKMRKEQCISPSYREDATKEKEGKTIIGDRKYHQLEVSDPKWQRLLH